MRQFEAGIRINTSQEARYVRPIDDERNNPDALAWSSPNEAAAVEGPCRVYCVVYSVYCTIYAPLRSIVHARRAKTNVLWQRIAPVDDNIAPGLI